MLVVYCCAVFMILGAEGSLAQNGFLESSIVIIPAIMP